MTHVRATGFLCMLFGFHMAPVAAAAAGNRQLFTISLPAPPNGASVLVPVRLSHKLGASARSLTELDPRYDGRATFPVLREAADEVTVLLPSRPAGRRIFWLSTDPPPASAAQVRLDGITVTTRTYIARLSPDRGGILESLCLITRAGRRIETLGKGGVQWNWTGSAYRADQPSCGPAELRVLEAGPLRVCLQATSQDVGAPGNTFTVTTYFYPDCIDQHYQFSRQTTFQTSALKLWCFLSVKGYRPGYAVGHATPPTPLRRSGQPVWIQDPLFVDMTFDDPDGFGLGFIGLRGCRRVYFNDVAGADEEHNLFVDATGYTGELQDVTADVDEWIRLVPHGPGPLAWTVTRALAVPPKVQALGVQVSGGPTPDSDRDGLDDLTELRRTTNPLAPDTDADSLPDGKDAAPLQHANPGAAESPVPRGPLAPPVATDRPQAFARVENIAGNPTIVVNGQPFGPITFTQCGGYTLEYLRPFVAADMRIFSVYTDGGFSRPSDEGLAQLDRQMAIILAANPKAYVIVRPMYVETPEAWARDHPGELLTYEDGNTLIAEAGTAGPGKPHYSFASEVWKEDVARGLRRLIDHVRSAPYSDRVIGYFIGAGYPTEEWIYAIWGPDHSPAMQGAFRRFLVRRYKGSVTALRAAWEDPEADFATARPPSRDEWQATNFGDFWDPTLGCKVADYFRCHNETVAEKVEYFSRVVKAATGGQALCGFWYLNLACISHHFGGHQALEKMLGCPSVDLFGAPSPYENRDLGSDASLRSVTDSIKLHGKVWYSNTDTRTHLASADNDQYGRPPDLAGSLSLLTRDFASLLCRGAQGEWYEMGEWYRGREILDLMRRLQLIGRLDRRYAAPLRDGLAVIVDEDSLFRSSSQLNFELLERLRTNELSRLGLPVDFYFLGDLALPAMPSYRCYLFLNAFSLDAERRRLVRKTIERDGVTAIWLYAPGLLDPGDPRPAHEARMSALTGIRLCLRPERRVFAMRPVGEHPIVAGLPSDRVLGQWDFKIRCSFGVFPSKPADPVPVAHAPVVFADDPQAVPLACYVDGGETAFCIKRVGNRTSVWFGSPAMAADVLRRVLKFAGLHIYDDSNDVIYLSSNFLAVHAAHDPPQILHFPRPVDVYDLLADRPVARNTTEVSLDLPRFATGLYFYGSIQDFLPEWQRCQQEQAADLAALPPEPG
ncbi:MAG: hypothetical protein N2512_00400 [Armatimonadetes bacterium]|nr:hypothetical protein [Armatimonadota bacterium]